MKPSIALGFTLCSGVVLACSALLIAGPLTPPAGPVAGSYKTLGEVEPRIAINTVNTPGDADSLFRITAPGSYYLTGNVTGQVGKRGIEIAASGVTIDLMGYRLQGIFNSLDGIAVIGDSYSQLAIRNGSVCGWSGSGIDLVDAISGLDCTIENIHAADNMKNGIETCNRAVIRDCVVDGNQGSGILSRDSVIENCLAATNAKVGIDALSSSTVRGCTSRANGLGGFSLGEGSAAESCTSYINEGYGINAGAGTNIRGCTVTNNVGFGITSGTGSVIEGCTVRLHGGHGIQVGAASLVTRNLCNNNGSSLPDGAGIYVTGSDSRIEGNNCCGNDHGIKVIAADNAIIRNTCTGSSVTNWNVVAGNNIHVVTAPDSGAINGNSGGTSLGANEPNANFSF